MWRNFTANLTDLLFSISEVMDLSDESLVDHQIRTAFVSSELAHAAKLDYERTERIFIAALLHDIGALSPEEKVSVHVLLDIHSEPHCQRGGRLFRETFWLQPSAQIVDWHHTPMAEHKAAGRSLSDPDVLESQILFLADHLERAVKRNTYILHQVKKIKAQMFELAGDKVHDDVLGLLESVSATENFWLELMSKDLSHRLRDRSLLRSMDIDYETTRSIASVFKDMIDFRSRFTSTHSIGVAACSRDLAKILGFIGKDLQQIYLAGLLHDIGKLVVPNVILYKPAKLTPKEYEVILQHPYYTYRVLSGVRGFEQISNWASLHHERLDGSGYCNRLNRMELDIGSKIVAIADVATAISESRPYRDSGDQETVASSLREMSDKGLLEPFIVEAFTDNYRSIIKTVTDAREADEAHFNELYAIA
jgi:HD-GYP domain-containing protein (c-di-GMP phosphodiesterase class II)